MKYIFLLVFSLFLGTSYAQEGVKVEGNTVTVKDSAPVWPGCEKAENSKACFNQQMVAHLKKHYKFPKDSNGQLIRGKAVVSFHIDEEGKVQILSVEGPKKELNEEAKRIVLLIPVMKPGTRAGKPVPIKYTVPFTF